MFVSEQRQVARRDLVAANRNLDAALRGRDWSAGALREAGRRISRDAVIGLYRRVLLHHDRVVTPSGTFALCRDVTATVETARVIAGADELVAGRRADPRGLFLVVDAPSGRHLEPCKAGEMLKAQVFASRLVSAAATHVFDLEPALRLLDLERRYEALDGPHSRVSEALAALRAVEVRIAEEEGLPRRYRPRPEPLPLPRFAP